MKTNLTDAAKLSEQLTIANEELARLRTNERRTARATPDGPSGAWAMATRKLAPDDRARIADAINCARNIFRWSRRRNRLENTRWQHRDPGAELRRLARIVRRTRARRDSAA